MTDKSRPGGVSGLPYRKCAQGVSANRTAVIEWRNAMKPVVSGGWRGI